MQMPMQQRLGQKAYYCPVIYLSPSTSTCTDYRLDMLGSIARTFTAFGLVKLDLLSKVL